MNNDQFIKPSEQPDDSWETTVRDIARDFTYPPTPDIAQRVGQRLIKPRRPVLGVLKMAAVILLALTVVIVSVPQVRAFVVEIIRIGAIQIFIGQPTATPTPRPAATRTPAQSQSTQLNLASALEMPNETTFDEAVQQMPIQLPSYPASIGKPDHVYIQHIDKGVLVTLVWLVPGEPDHIWLTLDILNERLVASKFIDNDGQHKAVLVNKRGAEWLTGLHQIAFFGDRTQIFRQVNGSVLIWLVGQYGKLTYRLEGASSLEEAIRIAESMQDAGTP